MRDCIGGQREIKRKKDTYLPRLAEQEAVDYDSYIFRARFFNVTGRTLEAFVGFVFSKDPQLEFPPVLDGFILDATLAGTSFYNYCKKTVEQVTSIGRRGTLVDWDENEGRAYITHYEAEDIQNWDTMRINGRMYLSLLVLKELAPKRELVDDIFVHPTEDHWRIYQLVPDYAGNYYVVCSIVRRKTDSTAGAPQPKKSTRAAAPEPIKRAMISGAENFEVVDQYSPTRRGQTLNRIPFEFHNSTGSEPNIDRVPLEDLANTNISHYQSSADLEKGRHLAGNPSLFAKCLDLKGTEKIYVGSPVALTSENANADVKYVEFTGQGLAPLERALEEKKQDMAQQGARMLESQTSGKGTEAFETVQIRQSGEASVLLKIALACTESLSRVMQWVAWWHGTALRPEDLEKECYVRLNTEFLVVEMDSAMLTALTAAYQSNTLTLDEYFHKLQRGKIIRDDTKIEDFRKALAQSPVLELAIGEEKEEEPTPGEGD